MAKAVTDTKVKQSKPITASELSTLISQLAEHARKAGDSAADASALAKHRIELHGLDRKAFAFIRSLAKLNDEQRQTTLRNLVQLAALAGYFDQKDAFDDLPALISAAVGQAASAEASPKAAAPATLKTAPGSATVTEIVAKSVKAKATA